MKFSVEKYNSNFIQSQFPRFYESDGIDFIQFLTYYYQWAESQEDGLTGNPNFIAAARNIFDYRDIDNTLEQFLIHFQKKYLYGIPFNVIINKRFLLKHVLDVYRSKGNIQCYKLLFKLIYNQDIDVYLPRNDILKPSDGTWSNPVYIEVNDNGNLGVYVGKTIYGINSGVTAIVEKLVKENINNGIVYTFYLSNVSPPSYSFAKGETVIIQGETDPEIISSSPTIIGSVSSINVATSAANFKIGDILKIADSVFSNSHINGVNALLKVTGVTSTAGTISFLIQNGGTGYLANSQTFTYNSNNTTVSPASFNIGSISYQKNYSYNTDFLADYLNVPLNANSYGFPFNPSANLSTIIGNSLTIKSGNFGTISSLTNVRVGNNYISSPYIFVGSLMNSKQKSGTVSYSSACNVVNGTNTSFSSFFSTNSFITLITSSGAIETQVIKQVVNNTQITLYGNTINSSNSGTYKLASNILPANYTPYDLNDSQPNTGNNAQIMGTASYGNNNISSVSVLDSGKAYVDNEYIQAYMYNSLNPVYIANGGVGYSNGDVVNFVGGSKTAFVKGYVLTNNTGSIVSVNNNIGSNFDSPPSIIVSSNTGSGANLSVTISTYNTLYNLEGNIIKTGMGKKAGYWTTTRGFLNSDKYVQDSYFYQDFSYQIKAASGLEDYKNILYNTFHPTGSELFGEYYLESIVKSIPTVLSEQTSMTIF